ncbi:MAG TPA: cytochrome c oxidase subunit II [Steroidobacter sp.]
MDDSTLQSVLHPAPGSGSALLGQLGTVMYVGAAIIFLVVIALVIHAVLSGRKPADARKWVIGGGLVFPVIALSALLVYSISIGKALERRASDHTLRIRVTGKQWWWEVRYELPGSTPSIVLANEVHVPVGRPMHVELATDDVIHSFWVPALAGKVDMIPGRTNHLVLNVAEPGIHRGQCAEYCGGQHAFMALYVIAESPEEFADWLERQSQPVSMPTDPFLRTGYEMFFAGGCDDCHAVRGTPATATLGPDLTHVGSRYSLGAGMLRNHIGTMAGWIAGTQDVKPGSFMPSMNVYTGQELRALSAWLESLE